MASTIFFNGRVIATPGSYSEIDASALEQVGLGAVGIVAVLGTGEGGRPVSDITESKDIVRLNKPEKVRNTFRSGDLREVGDMLFAPGKDPAILGGAVEMVAMKTNPATQSAATFANAQGDALELTTLDYGAFTSQVNVSIADGTTQGKLLTITFEDVTESVDDLGGDSMFTLQYTGSSWSWDTMTAIAQAGGAIKCDATRDEAGLDGDIAVAQLAASGKVQILSSSAADTSKAVELWGLDSGGDPIYEAMTTDAADGTTPVESTNTFSKVLGARATDNAGTVTVEPTGGGDDVFVVAAAPASYATKGMVEGVAMFVNAGVVSLVADGATTKDVLIEGTSVTGATQREKVTLTGAVSVDTVGSYSTITVIALADVEAARTVTFSAEAAKSSGAVQNTVVKLRDYFNAKQEAVGASTYGFTLTLVTGRLTYDPDLLDVMVSAEDILAPASHGFLQDLNAIVEWVNTNSQLVSAAAATGATGGAPTNTTQPVFLSGGAEGTALSSHYQTALNLLKKIDVNTIVALTGDPAVHAAVDAHCAYMNGIGRSERDAILGAQNTAQTDVPTKDEYKSQVVDLNSANIRLCGQAIERFNTAGERAEFQPYFEAAVAAGMQAGSPVGTSLTFKYANVLGIRQDTSWDPVDDSEEMIQAGCFFMEYKEGLGRRWVRNVTTHLTSNNIAFIEASVWEAALFAAKNFRRNMEWSVGRPGFSGTINGARGIAVGTLGLLVDAGTIVLYRSLDIELEVDVLTVSVELAPVIPINFVKNTLHLVTVRQTAE